MLCESVGQSRGIWFTTLPVVGGRALEHCLVPGPVLPPVACLPRLSSAISSVWQILHGDGMPHTLVRREVWYQMMPPRPGQPLASAIDWRRSERRALRRSLPASFRKGSFTISILRGTL